MAITVTAAPKPMQWKVNPAIHHQQLEAILNGLSDAGYSIEAILDGGVSAAGAYATVVAAKVKQ